MNKTLRANICILITAMIWGSAFVTQKMGMDSMGPIFFVSGRMLIGAVILIIIEIILELTGRADSLKGSVKDKNLERKTLLKGGLVCGFIICTASVFQQVALVSIDAGKAGFLTALYIIIVPLLGILLKQKIHSNHIIAAVVGAVGLYFLCISSGTTIAGGDLVALVGALFWALHILAVDHFAPMLNPIKLSIAQFLVCSIVSAIVGFIAGEDISPAMIQNAGLALLYTGVMSSAVGFTLQTFAQRDANPTAASILMSLEAVFATIAGILFLGERLTSRELFGCLLMMIAVIFAQFTFKEIKSMIIRKNG